MKKIVLASTLLAVSSFGHAETSPLSGFYAGGNVSRVQAAMTIEDSDCWYNCSAYTQEANGANFGIQGGYNWVQDNLLMGASLEYLAGGVDETYDYSGYGSEPQMHAISELKSLISLRFRAGLTLGKTALVISTGPAQGDFESQFLDADYTNTNTRYAAKQSGSVLSLIHI